MSRLVVRYDPQARAAYCYVDSTEFRIARRTIEMGDGAMYDLDENGELIGVEILGVDEPVVQVLDTGGATQALRVRREIL